MDTIRYGVIGTGMMGLEHIANIDALDGAEVTAIADPDNHQRTAGSGLAGGVPGFTTHQELLDSGLCDAVVVAAPNFRHREILLDAIDAGVHILVEKPLCITTKECDDVIAAAEGYDRVVWVGLEYRYMPPIAAALERLRSGVAGDVRMIAIREHRFPFLPKVGNWNRFTRNTGGTLVEKCCHFFDLMNLVAGAPPVRVMASGGQDVNHLEERYDGEAADMLDNAFVVVEYANGRRGMLDLCMFADGSPWEQEVVVTGSAGRVSGFVPPGVSHRPGRLLVDTRENGVVEDAAVDNSGVAHVGLHHGSSFREHMAFTDAIRRGAAAEVTLADGRLAVAVGEAAGRSIAERRIVEIAEVTG